MQQRLIDRLKDLRGELTQAQFADKTGIYMLALSQLENGKRRLTPRFALMIEDGLGEKHLGRTLLMQQLEEDLVEAREELKRDPAMTKDYLEGQTNVS